MVAVHGVTKSWTRLSEQQDSLESLYICARSTYFISVWVLVIGKSGHERKYQRTTGSFLLLILLFLAACIKVNMPVWY